jgi:uroporphyrinogen-III decarboxylase
MISPAHFREYILPSYKRQMAPAGRAGAVVHMHCDGQLHALLDDLLTSGIEVLNLQDLVNGIDWIEQHVKGRVAIDLDIDRQEVTVHGRPDEIDALVRREVEQLGSREGGLTMIYGLYPGTPLDNARAVAEAMRRYAGYFND